MAQKIASTADNSHLSRNEKFLQKLMEIVEANLGNEQFGVEQLASEIAMSRTQLYRRLYQLTGKNINQFIREVRLERAKELLLQDVASVAEIAYRVGFTSPSYFNKCFHDMYGYPPGEISKLKQQEELGLIIPERRAKIIRNKKNHITILGIDFTKKSSRLATFLIMLVVLLTTVTIYFINDRLSVASSGEKSIAVLPFRNESPEPENEYFCNGMVEEIITNLQGIKDIRVKSRNSVEIYRNAKKDLKRIARELGVSYMLEGSVLKSGEDLRIIVRLVNGKTGDNIWTKTYDEKYSTEIFEFQQNIAFQIAEALHVIITPAEKQKLAAAPAVDITAYDYILRAREERWKYWMTRDTFALKKAETLYDKALQLDPDNAQGWAAKGGIYYDRHLQTEEYYKENYLDSVFWFCDKARHLDIASDPYILKAMVYHYKGDIKNAIQNYEKDIKNNPEGWSSMWRLGFIYLYNKEYQKGFTLLREAVELSKVSTRDYGYLLYSLADAYLWIGDYREAENYYLQSREIEAWFLPIYFSYFYQGDYQAALDCWVPCSDNQQDHWCFKLLGNTYAHPRDYETDIWGWYLLGNIYLQLREYETAVRYFQQLRKARKARGYIQWDNLYMEGIALVELGHSEEGMKLMEKQLALLNKRKELGRTDGYDYHLAAIYAYLGEYDKTLQHLKDYSQKILFPDHKIVPVSFIQHDILFDPMRNNPEFKALLKQDQDEKAMARALIWHMGNSVN